MRRAGTAGDHELVHPRFALERADDLDEVQQMIEAGEIDIAIDELRWLLTDCHDFLDAHQLLGELHLADGDLQLARAHFGYAYDIGLAALPSADWRGTLPFRLPANRGFLTGAKGLAFCFQELGQADRARAVAEHLLALDPSDPLRVREWLARVWPGDASSREQP